MGRRTKATKYTEHDVEFAKDMSKFVHDPLSFVRYAYPWGSGALSEYDGPQLWQKEVLNTIGDSLTKNPYEPIRIARSSGHGCGKLQPKNLVIDTPLGLRRWGDLNPGDFVFGADGYPTKILQVHEHGVKEMYKIMFDDGSSTLCGAEHLWNVRGRNSRRTGAMTWETLETQEILRRGVKRSNGSQANKSYGGAKQWEIPQQGVAMYDDKDVVMDAYIIGLWLGNGSRTSGSITIADDCYESIKVAISACLPESVSVLNDGDKKCKRVYVYGIRQLLNHYNLLGRYSHERFVPDDYKYNSLNVRLEVLRGLMDTDGECSKNGSAVYASTSKQLVEDIMWLVRSLGGKAMLQSTPKQGWYPDDNGDRVICKTCYRCTIRMPEGMEPFHVKKKLERYGKCESRYITRWIESIEQVEDAEAMCITVANPDGLYLANDFIVTHNSSLVAWLVEWGLYTCPNARILVTANTATQLSTKTWPELSTWHNRNIAKHWFTLTGAGLQYSLAPGYEANWRADAVTWSQSNTEAFAGLHNKSNRIILIFDEASAIIDKIWEVAEGALTDENTEIIWIAFGNPTRNTGRFRECFRRYRNLWNTARIDSRTVPITNKNLFEQWKESYGEDSDFFRVRVTGEFPDQATGQLIATSLVHEAMNRKYKLDDITEGKPKILGVDCAREGGDASCIWLRQGFYSKRLFKTYEIKSNVLASKVASVIDKEKPDRVFIDMGNIGAAIVDQLKSWGYMNVTGVWFANSPDDNRVFANKRIEMWDRMRQWLEDGGMLPPSNCDESLDIENDLIAPEYFYTSRGLKMLESKKDMKSRGLPSPDDGDCLGLTFATKIVTKRDERNSSYNTLARGQVPMANASWNPYKNLSLDDICKWGD